MEATPEAAPYGRLAVALSSWLGASEIAKSLEKPRACRRPEAINR